MQSKANIDKPAVIVVSSHVVRGSIGNRACVFALETLGFPVWALPTVVLPWHPGHRPGTRIVANPEQFAALTDDLCRAPWLGEVGAIVSGYLGDPQQAASVAKLVIALKQKRRDAVFLCDPVIGDGGQLYVPNATAEAIRDRLVTLADILTPNRYEFEWLTGDRYNSNSELIDAVLQFNSTRTLITSAFAANPASTGNLLVTADRAWLATHRRIDNPPNGLGDLTSALFLARILAGVEDAKALQTTTASVFEILARTAKRGADELTLETDAASFANPMALVQLQQLPHPSGSNRRA